MNLKPETIYKLVLRYDPNASLTSDNYIIADLSEMPSYLATYTDPVAHWYDQAQQCSHCYCLITDHHDKYETNDGDTFCDNCTEEFAEDVVEDCMFYADSLPVYPKALPRFMLKHIERAGFVPLNTIDSLCTDEFESGLYQGMDDNPSDVARLISDELGPLTEVVFVITDSNPFMVSFSAYVKLDKEV
jgi:hypothetical protein